MAAGFSASARLLATLLLLALSLVAWKWMQQPAAGTKAASSSAAAGAGARKKTKKKAKKKTKKADDERAASEPPQATDTAAQLASNNDKETSDSDSDSDDGRPAAEVLATRRFKPAALGGSVSRATPVGPRFELGQRVFARFQGGDAWFPAVVTEVRRGNTYHLRYDDGETEFHVAAALIRPDDPSAGSDAAGADSPVVSGAEESSKAHAVVVSSLKDRDEDSSEDENADREDEDDGWHVVSRTASSKAKVSAVAAAESETLVDGLTKRQRENRRKKERQREIKEMARLQAQSGEFNARARMKYVPPPPSAGQ